MIFIVLMLVCCGVALMNVKNKIVFWRWLALANTFTAINCFLTAQFGLGIIISLAALGMIYIPEYIRKSFR